MQYLFALLRFVRKTVTGIFKYSEKELVVINFTVSRRKFSIIILASELKFFEKKELVHAILLHPSCSGSGTVAERLDHLLPSHAAGQLANVDETERLTKLASFQKKALTHALYFPQVERIVYSTCSIHQIENEDVVKSILPLAASHGFRLATLAPSWSSVSRRL